MTGKIASISSTGNIFADGELPDAGIRYAKSQLAITIIKAMREKGITQTELAKRVGVSQPRISLMCGSPTSETSIEAMLKVLAALDYDVTITPKRRLEPSIEYQGETKNVDTSIKKSPRTQTHGRVRPVYAERAERKKVIA